MSVAGNEPTGYAGDIPYQLIDGEYVLYDTETGFGLSPEEQAEYAAEKKLRKEKHTTSTLGWDTVYAIRAADANKEIVAAKSSPKDFSQAAPDGSGSVKGTFGNWQIAATGDGVDLHMTLPLTSGSVTTGGATSDLEGATATIEVRLAYLPTPVPGATTPSQHDLVVSTETTGDVKVVSVLNVEGPSLDGVAAMMTKALLELWLNANLATFRHTFSAVTLNRIVDDKSFEWLAPTSVGYAFAQGPDIKTSTLGVLCMTETRSDAGLARQLSPFAIPEGATSGFLISQERMLSKLLLPHMTDGFPKAKPDQFELAADGGSIVNTSGIDLKPIHYGGATYHPKLQDSTFELSIQGDELVITSKTVTDVMLGIKAYATVTAFLKIKSKTKRNGKQTLTFEKARKSIKRKSVSMWPKDTYQNEVLVGVAAGLLSVALICITDGGWAMVINLIVGLIIGLVDAIPPLVAKEISDKEVEKTPSLELLKSNCTDPIVWAGSDAFKLTKAQLAGALQLGGEQTKVTI